MKKGAIRLLAATAIAAVLSYWFWRQWWMGSTRPDFEILLRAALRLSLGESVYQISEHAEHTKAPGLTWIMQVFLWVPEWLAKAIWDAASWGSLLWLGRLSQVGFSAGVMGWLLVAGPWWAEMRLGQYNMLLAGLSLGIPLWESQRRSPFRGIILGAVCWFAILLKPTQLILIPFMLSSVLNQRRWKWSLLGFVGLGALISVGYSLQWSWRQWVLAHQEWLSFLPLSEAKHLLRSDNLGLPTLLARLFGNWIPSAMISKLVLLAGMALAFCTPRFVDGLLLSIICSPMAWRQNYAPLFLLLSWIVFSSTALSYVRRGLFWSCAVAFGLLASDLLGPSGSKQFGEMGGPLCLAIVAWWAARPVALDGPQLSRNF